MAYDESLSLSSHVEQLYREVYLSFSWLVSVTLTRSHKLKKLQSCEQELSRGIYRRAQVKIARSIDATLDMERQSQKEMTKLQNEV